MGDIYEKKGMTTPIPSIIGQSLPRIDAREKVTGGAGFTVDVRLPGMLWGKALRSPYAHARILRVDASRALDLPGVKAVLTPADVPPVPFVLVPPPHGVGDQYILNDQARFVGEAVAAVVAMSREVAEEAIDLVEVEYEELPAIFDPEEALQEGAPQIHAGGNLVGSPLIEESGDLEQALKESDQVFEDRYVTSRQCHCALETHACLAHYDASGKLTLWSSTQTPFGLQEMLSHALGLPPARIRVIAPYVGGAFGGKFRPALEGLAALLSIKTGRPVRMECDRQEEFAATCTRHRFIVTLRAGVKKDGTLLAREARVLMDSGAYADLGLEVMKWAKMCFEALYRARALRYEGRMAYTNSPVGGAYRGFGNPQITFAVESQMDAIAQALRIDPLELRLKNYLRAGESSPLEKWTLTSSGLSQCLKLGAERIGWRASRAKSPSEGFPEGRASQKESEAGRSPCAGSEGPEPQPQPAPPPPRPTSPGLPSIARNASRFKRGLGLACMVHGSGARTLFGAPDLSACFLKLNDDGTVHLLTGSVEIGQGSQTALAQVEGALHHGIGYALTEGLMLDPEGGQPLNSSFADYKLLTALDMPPVEALLVESIDPVGPFGAKGVGEPAMVAAAPAIANAIYDAVGVRIKRLPITPERVLEALRAARSF